MKIDITPTVGKDPLTNINFDIDAESGIDNLVLRLVIDQDLVPVIAGYIIDSSDMVKTITITFERKEAKLIEEKSELEKLRIRVDHVTGMIDAELAIWEEPELIHMLKNLRDTLDPSVLIDELVGEIE